MRTVLFFTDIHAGVHATEYIGACERAAALGWRVIEIEYARTGRSAAEFINHWQPDGLIVECGHLIGRPNLRAYGDLPAVFIDPKVSPAQAKSLFIVKQDAAAISAAAYNELAAANPAAYAFVGWAGHQDWSLEREATFHDFVRRSGKRFRTFGKVWTRSDFLAFHRSLTDWLHTLPRPCAVFAANDETAEHIAVACSRIGLSCPDDIVLIGANNEQLRCETGSPTITSVEIDYLGAGRAAADLLERQLAANGKTKPETVFYGLTQVVRRNSTRVLRSRDSLVHDILDRIARDACAGLSSADILKSLPSSRRSVEQRFRAAVGHSIGEEIFRIRFEKVLRLLADPRLPIEQIASDCGWESASFLKRTFRRLTGMTMREWRLAKRESRG